MHHHTTILKFTFNIDNCFLLPTRVLKDNLISPFPQNSDDANPNNDSKFYPQQYLKGDQDSAKSARTSHCEAQSIYQTDHKAPTKQHEKSYTQETNVAQILHFHHIKNFALSFELITLLFRRSSMLLSSTWLNKCIKGKGNLNVEYIAILGVKGESN